jgi:pilus assembly protein Flp/PilA
MTSKFATTWQFLLSNRKAVTALEYSLIAGLVALVIIATVSNIGTTMSDTYNKIATKI